GITLVVYAALAVLLLVRLGPAALAASPDPIAAAVPAWLAPVVRAGAAVAALGSLLALILGVSRTTLAMSRDGHLPRFLAAVHPRYRVPHRAELAVGLVVAVLAATIDLRAAIGFSSFAVLTYYAIANAAALTLKGKMRAVLGLTGCVVLAFSLPLPSVLAGCAVVSLGGLAYGVRRVRR
ncbi:MULTISPECIES: amino acid permease, partial [Amycolatopsis]|uniref:amino acid permease n=1 Tax=Amycolatopsis TaxID=1813 RepID=UPI00174D2BB0